MISAHFSYMYVYYLSYAIFRMTIYPASLTFFHHFTWKSFRCQKIFFNKLSAGQTQNFGFVRCKCENIPAKRDVHVVTAWRVRWLRGVSGRSPKTIIYFIHVRGQTVIGDRNGVLGLQEDTWPALQVALWWSLFARKVEPGSWSKGCWTWSWLEKEAGLKRRNVWRERKYWDPYTIRE